MDDPNFASLSLHVPSDIIASLMLSTVNRCQDFLNQVYNFHQQLSACIYYSCRSWMAANKWQQKLTGDRSWLAADIEWQQINGSSSCHPFHTQINLNHSSPSEVPLAFLFILVCWSILCIIWQESHTQQNLKSYLWNNTCTNTLWSPEIFVVTWNILIATHEC